MPCNAIASAGADTRSTCLPTLNGPGQRLLLTQDGFAFVAAGAVIVTCFQLGG